MLEKIYKKICTIIDFLMSRRPMKWVTILAIDICITVCVLLTFALFHHVLPRKSTQPITDLMPAMPQYSPNTNTNTNTATGAPSSDTAANSDTTPTVYPTGDFSATFPDYDTGVNALYSYQTNDLRIAINIGYGAESTYYWADVWVRNIQIFRTAFADNQFGTGITEWPLDIANSQNAIFAVTGDYCGARSEGLVIRNGKLYRDSLNSDVCILLADGTMETFTNGSLDLQAYIEQTKAIGIWQGWGFGPALLRNGQAIPEFSDPIRGINPRCAMGYYEPGHYCFVVVDGRQGNYSNGMTLTELSTLFAQKGCKVAFNLDGGQTSAMIFNGTIINKPYDGGRRSSDIVCFPRGAQ